MQHVDALLGDGSPADQVKPETIAYGFRSDHARDAPVVYAHDSNEYRRHVVETDMAARDVSRSRRNKLQKASWDSLYVDPIEVGGDYAEIPLSKKEQYGVIEFGAKLAKKIESRVEYGVDVEAAPAEAAPAEPVLIPLQRAGAATVNKHVDAVLKSNGGAASSAAAAAEPAMHFDRHILSDPLYEMTPEFWFHASHLCAVKEAYVAFLPELQVPFPERPYEPLAYHCERMTQAGLTVHVRTREYVFSRTVPPLLHIEATFFSEIAEGEEGLVDGANADDSVMDAIDVTELASLVEDRLRVHFLFRASDTPMWPTPSFKDIVEPRFIEDSQAYTYRFVCYFFKIK